MTELHLCSWRCWLACVVGAHRRPSEDGKCHCCGHRNFGLEQERARTSEYPGMTLRRERKRKTTTPTVGGRVRRLFRWAA